MAGRQSKGNYMTDENAQAIVAALNSICGEMQKQNEKLDSIREDLKILRGSSELNTALSLAEVDFDGGASCSKLSDAIQCTKDFVDKREMQGRFDQYIFGRRTRFTTRDPIDINIRKG